MTVDIIARRERGETLSAIAADLGITRQAVHHRLKKAGHTKPQPLWHERRAAFIEDIEWLIEQGESPAGVVVRSGYANRKSLARALRRADRADLARYVERTAA